MKKTIALVVTLVLVGAFALTATMAYLTGETAPVTNVFVIGDITIKLDETNWKPKAEDGFKGKIIPGEIILKNPTVTVTKGSEACYLYMYVENTMAVSTGPNTWAYVTPNINENKDPKDWEFVDSKVDANGTKKEVYRYKEVVNAKDEEKKLTFFSEVKVPDTTFTKESMQNLVNSNQTMTVEAFAYQAQNVKLEDANKAATDKYLSSTQVP